MDDARRFYSVSETARRFDVTSQTVRNWIAGGRLPAVQPGPGGRYRIPAPALRAFEQASGLYVADDPSVTGPVDAPVDRSVAAEVAAELAAELEAIVEAIVAAVHPDGVILFGSRARGDARADSDVDLAIVAPDGSARRRLAMRAYESLAAVFGRSVGVDIVVLTPSIIAAERDLAGSVVRAVIREGVVLYGSRDVLA